ncbi:MAG: alkaline phosphatase [Gammaproteobacteria bacterium]
MSMSLRLTTCLFTLSIAGCAATTAPAVIKSDSTHSVNAKPWFEAGDAAVDAMERQAQRPHVAKNVILFVGDGMSLDTITSARILAGQRLGKSGEEHRLTMDTLAHTALIKTYTTDMQVPDSAGTATAMLSGVKTKSGVIGVDAGVIRRQCAGSKAAHVESFLEHMAGRGKATGVISTARITHATPAAAYAHSPERGWEVDGEIPPDQRDGCVDIAVQLTDFNVGNGIDVVLGGGRAAFMPTSATDPEQADRTGAREDGRNLIDEWQTRYGSDAEYVWNAAQLNALDPEKTERIMGLFEPSHMMYEDDRRRENANEPSLAELTAFAVKRLQRDDNGFFLLVEGGRIDHAHHGGNASRALGDTVALDDALARAMSLVNLDETLIIVTADHGHVMSFSGYPRRGNPILGKVAEKVTLPGQTPEYTRDKNGLPYTTLNYANGSGHRSPREDLTDVDTTHPDYKQDAAVPLSSETHSGTDVIVFAEGPGAALFRGVQEQNYIYHVMRHAVDTH